MSVMYGPDLDECHGLFLRTLSIFPLRVCCVRQFMERHEQMTAYLRWELMTKLGYKQSPICWTNFIGVTYRSEWGVTYRLLIMIQWQLHHEIPTSEWAESVPPLSCLVYLRASPSSPYSLIWGGRILVHLVSFRDFLKCLNCLLPGFYRASL